MPYWRLMYDWDNNYTKKEKRMILLTQEAIDKINGLTPGGWAEYTAGSWIAISAQNVISNTKQFDPTNAWTTWQVLKKVGNSYSWANAEWWAMFVTQEEYDALPSSKLTDGIEYIIVDTHCELLSLKELRALNTTSGRENALNECPRWYQIKFWENGIATSTDVINNPSLINWKYLYQFRISNTPFTGSFISYYTNFTIQELSSIITWASQETLNFVVSWEWKFIDGWLL